MAGMGRSVRDAEPEEFWEQIRRKGGVEYKIYLEPDACDMCDELKSSGKISEITPSTRFPQYHPNCRCRLVVYDESGKSVYDGQPGRKAERDSGSTQETAKKANPNNVRVNQGQQDKHIPGTNNYNQLIASGKNPSILKANPQELLDNFAGTGVKIGVNKERVDFGKIIGQYYHNRMGKYLDTTNGIIHYDSKGSAHIVPARPNGY
jgi:hypothetical protein